MYRGGYCGVYTKLGKEALTFFDRTDVDTERCEVIAEQLEVKMRIFNELNDEIIGICEINETELELEDAQPLQTEFSIRDVRSKRQRK